MKKYFVAILLIAIVTSAPLFGFGYGGAFGLDIAGGTVGPGALLSVSFDTYPIVFGIGASFGDGVALGATADWWLYYANLVSILALYIGPGVYIDVAVGSGSATLGAGVRIPVGLQAWVLDPLELFLEIAPTFGLKAGVFPAFGFSPADCSPP